MSATTTWKRLVWSTDNLFVSNNTPFTACLLWSGVLPAPTVRTVGQPEQDAVDVLLQLKSFSLQGEVKEEESQAGAASEGDGTSGKRYKPSISDRAPASPAKHSDPWASLLQASEDHAATMEASSGLTAGVVELPPQHMYTGRMVKLSRPGSETNLIPSDVPPENLLLSTDDSHPSGRSYLAQLLDAKSESKSSGKCRPEVVNAVAVQCESAPMSRVPTVVEETVQQWCGEAMQRIDLFVFPEDFVDGTGKISLVKNKYACAVSLPCSCALMPSNFYPLRSPVTLHCAVPCRAVPSPGLPYSKWPFASQDVGASSRHRPPLQDVHTIRHDDGRPQHFRVEV